MGWEGEEQTYKLQHGLVSGIARLLPQGSGIVDAAKEIGKDGSPAWALGWPAGLADALPPLFR